MSNLIHSLQKHLDLAAFLKVNPNTQDVAIKKVNDRSKLLDQACITTVLLGLYQYTRDVDKAGRLLNSGKKDNWVATIFKGYPTELGKRIAKYTGSDIDTVRRRMGFIADKSVEEIQKHLGDNATAEDLKYYMSNQRNNILSYLPSELRAGEAVHNTSLDDAFNKMHGPFSDFMHWFEELFANAQKPLY